MIGYLSAIARTRSVCTSGGTSVPCVISDACLPSALSWRMEPANINLPSSVGTGVTAFTVKTRCGSDYPVVVNSSSGISFLIKYQLRGRLAGDNMHMNPLLVLIITAMIVAAVLSLFHEGQGLALLDLLWNR